MAQSLSNLPIGAKIKFGKHSVNGETAQPITWLVIAKNHTSTPAYPSNAITLLTEKLIDVRCFDDCEPSSSNVARVGAGNSRYSVSNIDQWLNKDNTAGNWYVAQHSTDNPPNGTAQYINQETAYVNRPGFLNSFSNVEKNAILNTTIRVVKTSTDGGGYEDITRKVFLPSITELGLGSENSISEGSMWSYFNTYSRNAPLTNQAYNNTKWTTKPSSITESVAYWTRTPVYGSPVQVRNIASAGGIYYTSAYYGILGVRPTINLSSTLSVSDTTDSDGCYTMVWNSSPPMPTTFNVPATIYGGKATTLSWSSVTDPDGDSVTYQLEQSLNGGAYTTIYSGSNLSYTTTIAFGTSNIQFRVRAVDSNSASSSYNSSTVRTVINNYAPTISGSDSDLGTKNAEFTQTYTISDLNANTVTVTEAVDGVRVRSYTATLGATNTFSVTGATWLTLANGSHTMTITATDGVDSTVRTYTFVKSVNSFTIQSTVAKALSTRPTRIKLTIGREIPAGATFKVEVCNNGFDTTKTWEDATSAVTGGLVHIFTNTTKSSTNWGVLIRVTVERNGTSGACYVNSIGGNFE